MNTLTQLFDHEIDYIIKDQLLSAEQAARFADTVTHHPEWEEIETPSHLEKDLEGKKKPSHIFYNQYHFSLRGVQEKQYFQEIQSYPPLWKTITEHGQCDPFLLFKDYLKNAYEVDLQLAHRGDDLYFPLVIRALPDDIYAHGDYAPFEAKGWAVENVVKQIAWNLYLTDPQPGGETDLYEELWLEESQIDPNSYGVKDYQAPIKSTFAPKPGRLVLFNSQRFHSVRKSVGPRVAVAGFIGQTRDGEIVAWA